MPHEIIVFSTSYCPPCRQLAPHIVDRQVEGLPVIKVMLDERETRETWNDTVKELGIRGVPALYARNIETGEFTKIEESRRFLTSKELTEEVLSKLNNPTNGDSE